jgi:hypothetical protein
VLQLFLSRPTTFHNDHERRRALGNVPLPSMVLAKPAANADTAHMAAAKPQSPAMEFLVDALKRNPKAVYADLKAKADEKKLKVFPIMFGRAQTLTGIVKMPKRGQGKAAKARAAKVSAEPRSGTETGNARRGRQVDPNSKSGKVRALLASGMSAADIAKKVGCTTALVYNVKSTMGGGGGATRRGPGRPRAAASVSSGVDGIAGILDVVKGAERERAQLRAALEKIQAVVADALA